MFKVQLVSFIFLFMLKFSIVEANNRPYNKNEGATRTNKEEPNTSSCGDALINHTPPSDLEALHSLLENVRYNRHIDDIDEFKRLLEIVDVNIIKYEDGLTLLHIMASHFPLEILEMVINAGANLDARDSFGNTPLHVVENGENGKALLRAGANPNIKNNHGATPLHYALADMTEALIKDARVNVNAKDNFGYTPLDYAVNTTIQQRLVTEVRSRKDDMGQHYLGNRFQVFLIQSSIAIRNPTEPAEWRRKINALIGAGATVTIESPEVISTLNTLTGAREL